MDDYNRRHHRDLRYAGLTQPIAGGLTMPLAVPPRGRTAGPGFDAEASSYFSRAGIADAAAKTAINDFIVGVKSDFAISALSEVFDQLVLQANESAAAAVVDMTSNALNQTLVNSPTFTQWQGVTGSRTGAERYINTGFNPTTNAVRYTQNSHSFGFYNRSTGNPQFSMGAMSGGQGRSIYPDGGGVFTFYDTNATFIPSYASGRDGLLAVSRTASNASACYRNGTSLATGTNTPIAELNLVWALCGSNTAGTLLGEAVQSSLSFMARGMTSGEMSAFNTRVQTLKTAIGW